MHESHASSHPLEQQTPSAQFPERHWLALVQLSPSARRGRHDPSEQNAVLRQSEALPHAVRHAFPTHAYSPHEPGTSTHAPAPLQLFAVTGASGPLHAAAPHEVPAAPKAQRPAPLHEAPQGPSPGHSSAGSSPSGMKAQVPTLPGSPHASQLPAQGLSQHTPSTQNPEAHAAPAAHAVPAGSFASQVPSGRQRPVKEQS